MWNDFSEVKIQVVESEIAMALSLEKIMEEIGYAVSALVVSGEEAIKKAKEDKPDLVFMDTKLHGEIDGIEAAGEIHSCLNIPVIFTYASEDKEYLEQTEKINSYSYLAKPFEKKELHFSIRLALIKHRYQKNKTLYRDKNVSKSI